jgi:hypothetical protein
LSFFLLIRQSERGHTDHFAAKNLGKREPARRAETQRERGNELDRGRFDSDTGLSTGSIEVLRLHPAVILIFGFGGFSLL